MKDILVQMGIWWIADPLYWHFSLIMEDGRINVKKLSDLIRFFVSAYGVNVFRNLPFLVRDTVTKSLEKAMKYVGNMRNFLPFEWDETAKKYDKSKLNQIYFDNDKEIMKACARHNAIYQKTIFDICHGDMAESPFVKNIQGEYLWYKFSEYDRAYVKKILDTITEARAELESENKIAGTNYKLQIMFELENEPRDKGFLHSGVETVKMIKERGYPNNLIEWGVFFINNKIAFETKKDGKKELIKNPLWDDFKDAMRKAGLYDNPESENTYLNNIHNFTHNEAKYNEIREMIPHSAIIALSNDGQMPSKESAKWWEARMIPYFEKMKRNALGMKNYRTWKIEALYNGELNGQSMFNDFINGIGGVNNAHRKVFGRWLENFRKFPETIMPPLPEPEPIEPPEDEEITEEIIKPEVIMDKWKFFNGFTSNWKKLFVKLDFPGLFKRHWKGVIFGFILGYIAKSITLLF